MTLRFRGNETQSIDGKGRVSIPADFRPVIVAGDNREQKGERPTFVIVYGDEDQNYLMCYTLEGIEQVEARIGLMEDGSEDRDYMEYLFHGCTMNMPLGEDGRIVLPAKLRAKLQIEDKLFFIAGNDHFKVWKPETFAEFEATRSRAWRQSKGAGFQPVALLPKMPPKPATKPDPA